jgi:mgtE-like transporter
MGGLFGPEPSAVRQSLVALGIGLLASLVAGLMLGSIGDTLEELPGMLVLVPAAIGMRGTIFGALGARLGTSIHAGTFNLTTRVDTVLGQNVVASIALSLIAATALAALAKVVSVGFGIANSISLVDFLVISVVGGLLASAIVLVLTVTLAAAAVRYEWDLDNVVAPIVTAAGDMTTLPALYIGTLLVGLDVVSPAIAIVATVLSVVVTVVVVRTGLTLVRRIFIESAPVVIGSGVLSLIAGLTLEGRLDELVDYPALLALVPPFLASAGAIGGILSTRLTSKLHLGVLRPATFPTREARSDIVHAYLVAVPVFALGSLVADLAAWLVDLDSPGPLRMVAVSVAGGLLATSFAVLIAYYSAIVSFRVGLDPDNFGIPLVTSSIDLLGSISFILAVVVFVTTPGASP